MLINVGHEIAFVFPEPTALIVMLYLHPSRDASIEKPEHLEVDPAVAIREYIDSYGNRCGRVVAPGGRVVFRNDAIVADCGLPDLQASDAPQFNVQDLPQETLMFLLASRYCEVDSELKDIAWTLFGRATPGWPRVKAICEFVQRHIRFDYSQAQANRTALGVYRERVGVCRDYMHLAITFCRCFEHPGALLHRLSGRHRRAIGALPDGFQRVVRSVLRRAMVLLRCPQCRPADWPCPDGPRARRGGRGHDDDIRRQSTSVVHSVDQ